MISCLIVDDEPKSRQVLNLLLSNYCDQTVVVGQADSVETGIQLMQKRKPELLFLDIELAGKTGFDLLEAIPKRSCEVIFVTGFEQYAREAIRYSGMAYLLKPIDLDELLEAVERVEQKLLERDAQQQRGLPGPPEPDRIVVPSGSGYTLLDVASIMYLKAEGAYTEVTLKDRTRLMISKAIGEYEKRLAAFNFVRIHRSFVVNLSYVQQYFRGRGGYVLLKDGTHLDVSVRKRPVLLQSLGLA